MFATRYSHKHAGKLGFTMVELLVVLLILSTLAAMVIGVGHLLAQKQDRVLTQSNQKIILAAISKYADRRGGEVPANPADPGAGTYVDVAVSRPTGFTDSKWEVFARSSLLYLKLEGDAECMRIIDQLPRGTVVRGVLGEPAAFVDAYGNYMDYLENGAFGGPLLISGGPDGYIGGEFGADDIRSTGR